MKARLLTAGPTPVPEETLLELAKPVVYHRTPEFRKLLAEVLEDLQYVFRTGQPKYGWKGVCGWRREPRSRGGYPNVWWYGLPYWPSTLYTLVVLFAADAVATSVRY